MIQRDPDIDVLPDSSNLAFIESLYIWSRERGCDAGGGSGASPPRLMAVRRVIVELHCPHVREAAALQIGGQPRKAPGATR